MTNLIKQIFVKQHGMISVCVCVCGDFLDLYRRCNCFRMQRQRCSSVHDVQHVAIGGTICEYLEASEDCHIHTVHS